LLQNLTGFPKESSNIPFWNWRRMKKKQERRTERKKEETNPKKPIGRSFSQIWLQNMKYKKLQKKI